MLFLRLLLASLVFSLHTVAFAGPQNSYALDSSWPALPADVSLGQATGVAVDSHNHVFIFHRADREWVEPFPVEPIALDTVFMFDGDSGALLNNWGAELFIMPHGLSVDADDQVWVTDVGSQQVHKFSHEGELLLSLGEAGVQGNDEQHFALPSDVAILGDGRIYISDGYVNTRVTKHAPSGVYEMQWGTPGDGQGELDLPHGIAASVQRIYVADRNNSRLQIFDHQGAFEAEWQGEHIGRPYGVATDKDENVFLIDGGDQPNNTRSRVVILTKAGELIETFSAALESDEANLGHDIAVSKEGDVYVVDAWARTVRKFKRTVALASDK